jgi:molybdopterin converting factor small subunit
MRIGFFGKLRDLLGDEREIDAKAGETVGGLRTRLAGLFPEATADLLNPRTRACASNTIVGEDFPLAGHERIEFLPPLSGG